MPATKLHVYLFGAPALSQFRLDHLLRRCARRIRGLRRTAAGCTSSIIRGLCRVPNWKLLGKLLTYGSRADSPRKAAGGCS